MANIKQALKRARQSEKQRQSNKWQTSRMNTYIKYVLHAIKNNDLNGAQAAYKTAISVIDKMANKGIIHKNKAARHKSRLNKQVATLARATA